MIRKIANLFKKKEEKCSDLVPKGTTKITYPFEGYENLSLHERYKVIGEGMLENRMIMKS